MVSDFAMVDARGRRTARAQHHHPTVSAALLHDAPRVQKTGDVSTKQISVVVVGVGTYFSREKPNPFSPVVPTFR